MIEAMITGEKNPIKLVQLADCPIKSPRDRLTEALRGRLTEHHRFLLQLYLGQYDSLTAVDEKCRIVGEAFAPGARVSDVARRRDVSRSQIYQWRTELNEERRREAGTAIVGFVPVDVALDVAASTA